MQLEIHTLVANKFDAVWKAFDEELFRQLMPPFPRLTVTRFDGSSEGSIIGAKLNFILFTQVWESEIVEVGSDSNSHWFVDVGRRLPFFLKTWRHLHEIRQHDQGTLIVDAIEYTAPGVGLDRLLYPTMWSMFVYRKPVYRRVFGKPQ